MCAGGMQGQHVRGAASQVGLVREDEEAGLGVQRMHMRGAAGHDGSVLGSLCYGTVNGAMESSKDTQNAHEFSSKGGQPDFIALVARKEVIKQLLFAIAVQRVVLKFCVVLKIQYYPNKMLFTHTSYGKDNFMFKKMTRGYSHTRLVIRTISWFKKRLLHLNFVWQLEMMSGCPARRLRSKVDL